MEVPAFELLEHGFDAAEGIAQNGQQRAAFIGHAETARQAPETRCAEPYFQRAHLLAYGRLRDVQFVGGAREAEMPRRCFERSQCVERDEDASGLPIDFLTVRRIILDCLRR